MSGSLRGHFLIAGQRLRDPNFFRTVVLLLEHNEHGAMGLIVNRPTPVPVSKALQSHVSLPDCDAKVFQGGPVEPAALFILHNDRLIDPDARMIVPDVYVGSSAEAFTHVIEAAGENHLTRFIICAGCAGWGPGQLEGELSRNDWLTLPATADTVFTDDPHSLWDELFKEALAAHRILPNVDGNPELN